MAAAFVLLRVSSTGGRPVNTAFTLLPGSSTCRSPMAVAFVLLRGSSEGGRILALAIPRLCPTPYSQPPAQLSGAGSLTGAVPLGIWGSSLSGTKSFSSSQIHGTPPSSTPDRFRHFPSSRMGIRPPGWLLLQGNRRLAKLLGTMNLRRLQIPRRVHVPRQPRAGLPPTTSSFLFSTHCQLGHGKNPMRRGRLRT